MFAISLLFLAVSCCLASQFSDELSVQQVQLEYATYQSNLQLVDGVRSFLGMRYAAPPTGNLRWREPQPPVLISGIQNATAYPHQCFQASIAGSAGQATSNRFRTQRPKHKKRAPQPRNHSKRQSAMRRDTDGLSDEDCLFLDVHVPSERKDSDPLLPVIVYMHGGGYDAGNTSLYPVQDFVKSSNYGLIAVSIQYRLGLFGFLPGTELKNGGALNAGLLDQNFALQWVQMHIPSFGGDPEKVTIWGQSAGAGAMLQHLVAHGGNTQPPLFRAVLMNSPFLPFQYDYDDPIAETLYSDVVSSVNCEQANDTLACLRSVDAGLLLDADTQIGHSSFLGTYTFVPVVDGTFIIERPMITMERGKLNGEALLVTTNSDEGALFVASDVLIANNFTLSQYITELFSRLSQKSIQEAVRLYSSLPLNSVPDQASAVMGDSIFVCPALAAVSAFCHNGWKAELGIPPGTHALDLSYEFTTFGIPPTYTNPDFLEAWQQSFMSVALSLDPNVRSNKTVITPFWDSWDYMTEMMFNKTESELPVVNPFTTDKGLLERCAFWAEVAPETSQ